jgi:hypothetical protein
MLISTAPRTGAAARGGSTDLFQDGLVGHSRGAGVVWTIFYAINGARSVGRRDECGIIRCFVSEDATAFLCSVLPGPTAHTTFLARKIVDWGMERKSGVRTIRRLAGTDSKLALFIGSFQASTSE